MLEERTLSVKSPVNERGDTVDIKFQNIKASWSKDHIVNTLYNINLTVPKGQIFAIVGPVGAGKVINKIYYLNKLSFDFANF